MMKLLRHDKLLKDKLLTKQTDENKNLKTSEIQTPKYQI